MEPFLSWEPTDPIEYLEPVQDHADSYFPIFRASDGQKFICKDYRNFSLKLAQSLYVFDFNHRYFVDLTLCPYHSLFFDIDISDVRDDTTDVLLHYFKHVFVPVFERFLNLSSVTFVVAMRRNRHGGMRLHVPNFKICFDDYVHLCHLMRPECGYVHKETSVQLNCPAHAFTVASDAFDSRAFYVPAYAYQIRKFEGDLKRVFEVVTIPLPKKLDVFQKLKNPPSRWLDAACHMMPVPDPDNKNVKTLFYTTRIVPESPGAFVSYLDGREYAVVKEDEIRTGETKGSFCREFLKKHAHAVRCLPSPDLWVLNTWHRRFAPETQCGFFHEIETRLDRVYGGGLVEVLANPDHVLPVFYVLRNEMAETAEDIVQVLEVHYGIDVPRVPNSVPNEASYSLTYDTIEYLATRDHFEAGWSWIVEHAETDMRDNVRRVQEKWFPIVERGRDAYVWNGATWETLSDWTRVGDVLRTIHERLKPWTPVETEWIESLTRCIMTRERKGVEGNAKPDSETIKRVYGCDVPEYYFLKPKCDEEAVPR